MDEVEDLRKLVGLGEVVQVPVTTSRGPSEIREGAIADLGDGGPEAAQGEVATKGALAFILTLAGILI
ncbi:MAG: hypothetical protein ACREEC_14590, partial [Thermoplasmata archaeon]